MKLHLPSHRIVPLIPLLVALAAPLGSASAAPPPGEQSALLWRLDRVESKLLSLAEALPAPVWTWRPAKGVRSTAQAVAHVAVTNFKLCAFVGAPAPKGTKLKALGAATTRAEALAGLRSSLVHLRKTIAAQKPGTWSREATFWGRPSTVRRILLQAVGHSAEHLGQLIAYGRVNGVVPPWSRKH